MGECRNLSAGRRISLAVLDCCCESGEVRFVSMQSLSPIIRKALVPGICSLALIVSAQSAHSQIVVGNDTSNQLLNNSTSLSLDIDAGSNVVVLFSLYQRNNLAPAVTLDWAGGSDLSVLELVTESNGSSRSTTIYGFSLGTVTALQASTPVTFKFASDGKAAGTALQLSNATLTGAVVGKDEGSQNPTLDPVLSGLGSGSFVFAAAASDRASGVTQTYTAPSEVVFDQITSNNFSYTSAYQTGASGNYQVSAAIANGQGATYSNLVAVGIAPIPEPSTLAMLLGGVGALFLFRKRRIK